jgi:hypothetical protein
MARRKAKRKSRRKQPVKLLGLAQGALVGNAVTQGLFGTSLRTFLLDGWTGDQGPRYDNFNNSWEITLAEMVMKPRQGRSENYSFGDVLKHNFDKHGTAMIATVLLAGPAFKFGTRALGPLLRPVNKQLKPTGVVL